MIVISSAVIVIFCFVVAGRDEPLLSYNVMGSMLTWRHRTYDSNMKFTVHDMTLVDKTLSPTSKHAYILRATSSGKEILVCYG